MQEILMTPDVCMRFLVWSYYYHDIMPDESNGVNWGNAPLRNRVQEIKPRYHLFGHAHDAYGSKKIEDTVYSNGSVMNDKYEICHKAKLFLCKQ